MGPRLRSGWGEDGPGPGGEASQPLAAARFTPALATAQVGTTAVGEGGGGLTPTQSTETGLKYEIMQAKPEGPVQRKACYVISVYELLEVRDHRWEWRRCGNRGRSICWMG